MTTLVLGAPARGEAFFDRAVEQRRIWRALRSGHVLLLSPRRVGKTSLLYRLRDTAAEHGWRACLVGVAPARSELEFVRRLFDAVAAVDPELAERFDRPGADWTELGRALGAALAGSNRRWLLLVDEVPVFLLELLLGERGRERAVAFLDWFRDLREHAVDVRWVLAGSIGLDTLAERHRFAASVNDLQVVYLGAFAPPDAERFVAEIARAEDLELPHDVRARLVARVGWPLPFFLNLMVSVLLDLRDEGVPSDADAVERAFHRLVDFDKRSYFVHWRQRLYEQLDAAEAAVAHALLDAMCADDRGVPEEALRRVFVEAGGAGDGRDLAYLLGLLRLDGYAVEEGGRWAFRSPLLREYWRRYAARAA